MVKKIDFHIHTVASDKDYHFTYSSKWLEKYIQEAELDAIAITNHDLFDYENFQEIKNHLADTKVFPGIELSLAGGHVNVIFSEDDVENLVKFSTWLKTLDSTNNSISVEDYCTNMENWEEAIYIFEHGKSNTLKIPDKLKGVTSVGGVSNQLKFQSLYKKENKITPVLFSDAHASEDDTETSRTNIKLLKLKNTFLQVDECSFAEIKRCITNKNKVSINKEQLSNIIQIGNHSVSTGLNLIIGRRGTGKTEFLKNIKKHYDKEDIYEIAQFETARADEYIENQRKNQRQYALESWKNKYKSQFSTIKDYLRRSDNEFHNEVEEFLESVKQFSNDSIISQSTLKYKMIKEQNFESLPNNNLKNYLSQLRDLIDAKDLWRELSDSYIKKRYLIDIYNELRLVYIKKEKKNKIHEKVNTILDNVKDIIFSKTGISKVSNCDLSKIIQKCQTEKKINSFLETILKEEILKKENIHGYQIIVKNLPFENANQFRKNAETQEAVADDLIKPYIKGDYLIFLNNLKRKKFFKLDNLENYLMHMEVELLDSDGIPASGGQAVGFALMMRLEEAKYKPLILIDEPEASLDNAYIRNELIHTIKKLSLDSTVFVVTHNSTLGTLIDPDYLIVTAKNDDKEYQVLSGSFSSNIISEYNGLQEGSFHKFVDSMESGIENYYKKGEVYENLKD